MKKPTIALIAASILVSGSALAVTSPFDVVVDVQNVSQELEVSQVSAIAFPTIIIDESTKTGDRCYTGYAYSALCRLSDPETNGRLSGQYRVAGTKLAPISVELSSPVNVNGLKFTPSFHNYSVDSDTTATIENTGEIDLKVRGFLELVDPAAVTTKSTTFTFNITAAYN